MKKHFLNYAICLILVYTHVAFASSYSITTGGFSSGGFGKITQLLQSWVDFMIGPYGKAVVAGSFIIAVTVWAVAPKEGILGSAIRVAVAGAVILNVSVWMGMFS